MNTSSNLALAKYPAFGYFRLLGRVNLSLSLLHVNAFVAISSGALLCLASFFDSTWIMHGDAVGFFEHPGIFIFLVSQALIPYLLAKGISKYWSELSAQTSTIITLDEKFISESQERFELSIDMRTGFSRALYGLFLSLGITVFAWNTYQNQFPVRFVGIDFWDSTYHPWGYWTTRAYKLYLWCFLIPAVVHCHVMLLASMRNLLLSAIRLGAIKLDPFNQDECGGLRFFFDSAVNPMIPVVAASSLLTFAAFFVHEQSDVTTIGGAALTSLLLLSVYLVPALTLRDAIVAEKERQLREVSTLQKNLYNSLKAAIPDPSQTKDTVVLIEGLSNVCKLISQVPNWPQLSKVTRLVSAAITSPFLGLLLKQIAPTVLKVLKTNWG